MFSLKYFRHRSLVPPLNMSSAGCARDIKSCSAMEFETLKAGRASQANSALFRLEVQCTKVNFAFADRLCRFGSNLEL